MDINAGGRTLTRSKTFNADQTKENTERPKFRKNKETMPDNPKAINNWEINILRALQSWKTNNYEGQSNKEQGETQTIYNVIQEGEEG